MTSLALDPGTARPTLRDPYQRGLAIACGVSLLLHVAAFVAVTLAPSPPPRIDRDQVISAVLMPDLPPTLAPAAPAKPTPAPPPKQVTKPPEPVPPKVAPKVIPVDKPKPKPVVKKPPPKPAAPPKPAPVVDPEQRIKDIIARREKERSEADAPVAATARGGGNTLGSICQVQMSIYYDEIGGRVRGAWAYPGLDRRLETDIGIRLSRGGELLGSWIQQRSGDQLFDDSVKRALLKAAPFPPLPACYKEPEIQTILEFRSWEVG